MARRAPKSSKKVPADAKNTRRPVTGRPAWPLEWRDPAAIRPYPENPRENADAIAAVAASIQAFGFRQPIVVDAAGVIIVGHTRWKAAQQLGLARVPVHIAADLTPAQIRTYRIADNKTHELSAWNLDILAGELRALPDVDWQALGFSGPELAALLGLVEPTPKQTSVQFTARTHTCPACGHEF